MNYLTSIPERVQWDRVQGLNLSQNAFTEWPAVINAKDMPGLGFLLLSGNPIAQLSDAGGTFQHLRSLDLSYTKVSELPAWTVQSEKLRTLNLAGDGDIRDLSVKALLDFKALRFIDISGCGIAAGSAPFEAAKGLTLFVMKGMPPARVPQEAATTII
jgi:Leucine-rich repeat (LRR) protein